MTSWLIYSEGTVGASLPPKVKSSHLLALKPMDTKIKTQILTLSN